MLLNGYWINLRDGKYNGYNFLRVMPVFDHFLDYSLESDKELEN